MCFHAACFVAKRKEQDNLSCLTVSYLLAEVNVEEMVRDKFPRNWESKELSLTELPAAKTRETTWTQVKSCSAVGVGRNRVSPDSCVTTEP